LKTGQISDLDGQDLPGNQTIPIPKEIPFETICVDEIKEDIDNDEIFQESIQVWQSQVGKEQSGTGIDSTQGKNYNLADGYTNTEENCDSRNVHSKLYQCLYCDKILSSDNQVQSHIQEFHRIFKTPVKLTNASKGSSFVHKCLPCNLSFTLIDSIRHWKECHDEFICKYCKASFKIEEELANHTETDHSNLPSHVLDSSPHVKSQRDSSTLEVNVEHQKVNKKSSDSQQPVDSQYKSNLCSRRVRTRPQRFAETAQLSDCSSVEENESDSSEDFISMHEETSDSEIDDNETELKPKTATRPENPVPQKKKKVARSENKGTLISTFRLLCNLFIV